MYPGDVLRAAALASWLPTRGCTTVPSLSTCLSLASRRGGQGCPRRPPAPNREVGSVPAGTEVPGYRIPGYVPQYRRGPWGSGALAHCTVPIHGFITCCDSTRLAGLAQVGGRPAESKKKAPLFYKDVGSPPPTPPNPLLSLSKILVTPFPQTKTDTIHLPQLGSPTTKTITQPIYSLRMTSEHQH